MAQLKAMPKVLLSTADLAAFGATWQKNGGSLSRTPPQSSMELAAVLDTRVAEALAHMLGGIGIVSPSSTALLPSQPDVVERGACRIIGGIRPQNFDVTYRPDGVRIAFDSKTLNDTDSVRKNYQN